MSDVLVGDLRRIADLKVGDPMPEQLGPFAWAETLSKLCGSAADEIERLRSTIEQLRLIAGATNIERPFHDLKLSVKFGKNHTLGEFNDGE